MDIFYKKFLSLGTNNNLSTDTNNVSDIEVSSISSNKFKILDKSIESIINLSDCSKSSDDYSSKSSDVYSSKSSGHADISKKSNNKLTIDELVEKKYLLNDSSNKQKYYEEYKPENITGNIYNKLIIEVIKNNFSSVVNKITESNTIYVIDEHKQIQKICSNFSSHNSCTESVCLKSAVYYSLWNNSRGIKTIYNLLIRLIILFPKFRNKCKCCYDSKTKNIFDKLEEKYVSNTFNYQDSKHLELKINFLINKFMNVISLCPCECKYVNKYSNFYNPNYLNFDKLYKVYKKTIHYLIPMLTSYFNIKTVSGDLYLIKKSRCIHEDIRYNNFTYCVKVKQQQIDNILINNLVNDLNLVNEWLISSFKITLLLFNQQSLETFKYILYVCKDGDLINKLFSKVYSQNNNLLNLNYTVNKLNLVNLIFEMMKQNSSLKIPVVKNLMNKIIVQLYHKNKKSPDVQKKINFLMIQYIGECISYKAWELGIEFISHIKNLNLEYTLPDCTIDLTTWNITNFFSNSNTKIITFVELINWIFSTILNSNISHKIKLDYLKIINKNKINIIEYDFISKLIEIPDGEIISKEFTSNFNYFMMIKQYGDSKHLENIVKKCVINKKPSVLNFVFLCVEELKLKIESNPYLIYFNSLIEIKPLDKEREYIESLQIIIKYNLFIGESSLLFESIKYSLTYSAVELIKNSSNTNILMPDNKNLLYYCGDFSNYKVFDTILKFNSLISNDKYNGLMIHTYLFNKSFEENTLMRFLMRLFSDSNYNFNYSDKLNPNVGFQILNSSLTKENKIILFSILTKKSDSINPMALNNSIPLILHCAIIDEYEITYLLLNKLLKDKKIKKIEHEKNLYLDYEYTDQNININFIPIILKYVKENDVIKLDINDQILEVDIYFENIFIIILEIVVVILYYKANSFEKPFEKSFELMDETLFDNTSLTNSSVELDGYLSSDKDTINKEIKSDNTSLSNAYVEIPNSNLIKRNIWLNSNKKPVSKFPSSPILSSSPESIEETEISFG
jgi:hypothetical protein